MNVHVCLSDYYSTNTYMNMLSSLMTFEQQGHMTLRLICDPNSTLLNAFPVVFRRSRWNQNRLTKLELFLFLFQCIIPHHGSCQRFFVNESKQLVY